MSDLQISPQDQHKIMPFPVSPETYQANRNRPQFNGPLSGPMWRKVSALKSNYPDTFDWSVYDRLYERFGDKQPRGGVVFGQTLKLANYHSSCSKCHYSLELDTYGRGCLHNCKYCYAKEQLVRRRYWNEPYPMPVDLTKIREIFFKVFETSKATKWRPILEKRIPLRIGSMSDSFMWMDQKIGVTKELLRILRFYEYPYIIFTRSDLVAHDDYMSLLDKERCSIQFSISGNNEELNRKIEPGAPSIARRFSALRKLSDAGFWTTVRLNPLFPTFPDGYFTDENSISARFGSTDNVPKLELFDIEKTSEWMDRLKEARVPTLLAGFVRLTQNSIAYIGRDAGIDFKRFFRPELSVRGERVYSDPEIAYYYSRIRDEAFKRGIRFNTCYIGNGIKDFFQYQTLWSNSRGDCCDVLGNVSQVQATAQALPWTVRMAHAPDKAEAQLSQRLEAEWDDRTNTVPGLRTELPKRADRNEEISTRT